MLKAKRTFEGFIQIQPRDRVDLLRLAQVMQTDTPLEDHHNKIRGVTNEFKARSYWGALFLVERQAKAMCKDIAGPIEHILVGVEEVV